MIIWAKVLKSFRFYFHGYLLIGGFEILPLIGSVIENNEIKE
jgi:hypothetical protein